MIPLLAGCGSLRTCGPDDRWFGQDKAKHFIGSAALAAGVTAAAHDGSDTEAAAIGIASTMAAGLGKEFYDNEVKHTCFSWKDLAWDFLGASLGATAAAAMD